ncbi:MAG TPA: hypothetical protein VGV67_10825, partial [Solirubrobacteraceae bacterium]|nr:hypothetical protein [Solirubrobacteraceae bacterium]
IRPDGTDARRLTKSYASDEQPSWSPDGGRIAFTSTRHWRGAELWAMDADGSCTSQLTVGYDAVSGAEWRAGRVPVGRGACGTRVAPFNALDFAPLARQPQADPLFPGVPYRGMWPVEAGRGALDYDECSLVRRRDCGGRITVASYTTCKRNPAKSIVPALAVERHRGALVLHFYYRVHVISGGTTTEIFADNGKRRFLRRLVAKLRPLSRPNAVPRRLAAPQLPPQAWRALANTERVRVNGVYKRASLIYSDRKVLRTLSRLDAGRRPACAR